MICLCSFLALTFLRAEPAIETKVVPIEGRTSWNGWTYYGGPMLVQGMQASPGQRHIWLATTTGLVRLDTNELTWKRWTTFDGLLDNYTYDVDVDEKGNVWTASFSGLSKFDGKQFRNWSRKEIGNHRMSTVATVKDRVWIGCAGARRPTGAMCLLKEERFARYNPWFLDADFLMATTDIEPDGQGGVWLSGNTGVLPVDVGAGYYQPLKPELYHVDTFGIPDRVELEMDFWPGQLSVDKDGSLLALVCKSPTASWTHQDGTLYRLKWDGSIKKDGVVAPDFWRTRWEALGEPEGLSGPVNAIHRAHNGIIWVATESHLGTLEASQFKPLIRLPEGKGRQLLRFVVLNNGTAVFCRDDRGQDPGLFLWNGKRWLFLTNPLDGPIRPGPNYPIIGIPGRDLDGKLHFMRHVDTVFDGKNWTEQKRDMDFIYDKLGRIAGTYRSEGNKRGFDLRLKENPKGVSHQEFFGVDIFPARFRDSRGHFWAFDDTDLGTPNPKVMFQEFDGTKIIDHVPGNEFFLRKITNVWKYNSTIRNIAEDSKGRLWIGTTHGVLKHDGGTQWEWVGGRFDGMFGMMGWHMGSNGRDLLSLAGTWGTSEYDMLKGEWINFTEIGRTFQEAIPKMPGSYVEAIAADTTGRLWYGTYEGGVCYRNSNQDFTYFDTSNGLASNTCWGIWCDDDGTMWFSSQAGAQSLDLKKFSRELQPR